MVSRNPAAMRAVIQEEKERAPSPNYITHCPTRFKKDERKGSLTFRASVESVL